MPNSPNIKTNKKKKVSNKYYIDFIKGIKRLWSVVLFLVAFITYVITNNPIFYIFVLIACFLLDRLLWQIIGNKKLKVTLVVVITTSVCIWVGINGHKDIQKARGILFTPAKFGECLIIVAQFDQRGSAGYDPTTRIANHLKYEFKNAEIKNTRIEIANKICSEEAARRVGGLHKALFVIWGWYDDSGFNPKFTIIERKAPRFKEAKLEEVEIRQIIKGEIGEFNYYICEGLPKQMACLGAFTLGQLFFWQGKNKKALDAFNVALDNLQQTKELGNISYSAVIINLYFFRAVTQIFDNKINAAIDDFTSIIVLDSTNAKAYTNRGNVHRMIGNFDYAIADLTKALEIDSTATSAYLNLGATFSDMNSPREAVKAYNAAIRLDSTDADIYYNRGLVYLCQINLDMAITDFTKAIELKPSDATFYVNRGTAFRFKDNLDQAIADFTKAIEFDPTDIYAYNNRGNIFELKGDFDRAILDYTRAIKIDSTYVVLYINRGVAYRNRGLLKEPLLISIKL